MDKVEKFIIGESEDKALIEITPQKDNFNKNSYTKFSGLGDISNLASLAAQAMPTFMIGKELANKSIMEVVINGNLSKAADGNGLRAFSRAADGKFTEHARLFEVDSLSKIVNVAAIWQIASIVVAQKHLADISEKLDKIQKGVDQIHNFQQTERKTKIEAAFENIKKHATLLKNMTALEKEEYSATAIPLLSEISEKELTQVYLHLKRDIQEIGFKKVEHKETFGSKDIEKDIRIKGDTLKELISLAFTCLGLQLTAYQIIYEYNNKLETVKNFNQKIIKDKLEDLDSITYDMLDTMEDEVKDIKSVINDFQKELTNLHNRKGFFVGGLIAGMPGSIIGGVIGSKLEDKTKDKDSILDERKFSLLTMISSLRKTIYTYKNNAGSVTNTLDELIEKEPPIKLAFKKIDNEDTYLCINTGEKIKIPSKA